MKKEIIIDVDTGVDDALAILLAIKSRAFNIKGITTVGGNTNVENATLNTLKILKLAKRTDISVYKGSARPLIEKKYTLVLSMKPDGLAGFSKELPVINEKTNKKSAVIFLTETIKKTKGEINIVALAPLTNIAKAINNLKDAKSKIQCLYIMGGTIKEKGNERPYAEFNFYNDPKAASIVFKSGIPVVLISLDVTKKLLVKADWITKKYKSSKDDITKFTLQLINKEKEITGKDEFYLHDPLALGVAINKKFVELKREKLDIITKGKRKGQVIKTNKGYDIEYASTVKKKEFLDYFQKLLLK